VGAKGANGAGDSNGKQSGKQERMAESAVSELGRIGDSEAEGDDIQIGQDGPGYPGPEQAPGNGFAPQSQTDRERNGRM